MEIDLNHDNFNKIADFVYRKSGIALEESKHFDKVKKKLSSRYEALKIDNFRKYFFILRFEDKGGAEFQELMNALTVNETYFFRENFQFEALVNHVLPELHAIKPKNEALRILSAPCSTGEEPYSIAIHLLEQDDIVNKRDFEIVGIDIDTNVISKAKTGSYTDRSLHALPKELSQKYFKKNGMYNQISQDLKDAITFETANVFDKRQMRALGHFDVIFSRNMLIYFDDASRKDVAMTFYEMLNNYGYIMLGHAEYMNRIVSVFNAKKFGQALVYQKLPA